MLVSELSGRQLYVQHGDKKKTEADTVRYSRVTVPSRHAADGADQVQVTPTLVVVQVLHARLVHQ